MVGSGSDGLLAVSVEWYAGHAALTLTDSRGVVERAPIRPGERIGWELRGPRRCVGTTGGKAPGARFNDHRAWPAGCPLSRTVADDSVGGQCSACASVGAPASDTAVLAGAFREIGGYVAWHGGSGLLSVGLAPMSNAPDFLALRDVLGYTWWGYGDVGDLQRGLDAGHGIPAQCDRGQRVAAWWTLDHSDQWRDDLALAHERVERSTRLCAFQPLPCEPRDIATMYGLPAAGKPPRYEMTGLRGGSVVSGVLTCLVGDRGVLDTVAGPLLIDMRRLYGWHLVPVDAPADSFTMKPFD